MSGIQKRPAHRPSRRAIVVEAAMTLFATQPAETVTVADIAAQADMTSAAVYYHYPSKEHILLEGLQTFRLSLVAEVRRQVSALPPGGDIGELIPSTLRWLEAHQAAATVYFSTSMGLNLAVEALRRETRIELVTLLQRAVRQVRVRIPAAETGVVAVGLLMLLETGATSTLSQDPLRASVGETRFTQEISRLARRLAGTPEAG